MTDTSLHMGLTFGQTHAIITGGGKGIGAAIAKCLARQGSKVSILGRTESTLKETADDIIKNGGIAQYFIVDVTNEESIKAGIDSAIKRFGEVTFLINNAGAAETAPVLKMDNALWDRMIAVNLTSVFLCTKHALPSLKKSQDARIVNISSTAGVTGYQYVAAYCAAKHGVIGFTKALAKELSDSNITVNAICPGYTDTDLFRDSVTRAASKTGKSKDEIKDAFLKTVPGSKLITPEEIASSVVWLCDKNQGKITGQAIVISAGEVS